MLSPNYNPGAFVTPLESYCPKEGSGKLSANSVDWPLRFSYLKGAKRINNSLRSKIKFTQHQYYSSSRKGFPSHVITLHGVNAPFRVLKPPAGPEKLRFGSPESIFPKIWSIVPDHFTPNAQPKPIPSEHLPYQTKALTPSKVRMTPQRNPVSRK